MVCSDVLFINCHAINLHKNCSKLLILLYGHTQRPGVSSVTLPPNCPQPALLNSTGQLASWLAQVLGTSTNRDILGCHPLNFQHNACSIHSCIRVNQNSIKWSDWFQKVMFGLVYGDGVEKSDQKRCHLGTAYVVIRQTNKVCESLLYLSNMQKEQLK